MKKPTSSAGPEAYDAVRLSIANMSCGGCAARAQRALDGIEGVSDVSINFADGSGRLAADGPGALRAALSALETAGYPGTLAEDEDTVDHDVEQRGLRRDTLAALALGLPVFVVEMGGHAIPSIHHFLMETVGQTFLWTVQLILTTLVLIGPGRRFFTLGVPALLRGAPDMNSLVALGTGAAYSYSVLAVFAPGLFPEGTRAVYFESACVIVVLILLGRWMEARAKRQTGAAIERLVGLRPDTVRLKTIEGWRERPLAELRNGGVFSLRAGERIAADAVVVEGQGEVDESMLTGEPLPVLKTPGDTVTGGTINTTSELICEATATGSDSKLAQIIRVVQTAQATRLPIQGVIDRVTLRFVPAVLCIAALSMVVWAVVGPEPRLPFVLVVGVSVLIIACPCAMGLATPVSIMIGTGRAAELGTLFRNGSALQQMRGATLVAFDKTGTLTEGRPRVDQVHVAEGQDRTGILRAIAAVEEGSTHPVAQAIAATADGPLPTATDSQTFPGYGISATVGGQVIHVGKGGWLEERGVNLSTFNAVRAKAHEQGRTLVFAAIDGQARAMISLSDTVKPGAASAIAALKARGVRVALISGDNAPAVEDLAQQLDIDDIRADVLPTQKAQALDALRRPGDTVVFVGDGINDAPALAQADIGIAIGTGTDVAIDAADIVLMGGDPEGVLTALRVSDGTFRNIRQNLVWAFGYNVALIPVAAGALYPVAGLLLSPALAAGAMGLSSVFVVMNAQRLRRLAR